MAREREVAAARHTCCMYKPTACGTVLQIAGAHCVSTLTSHVATLALSSHKWLVESDTVTRSSQEELMWALSLNACCAAERFGYGLAPEHLAVAVTTGFMTITELDALMRLIRSPDSHFVEVPSLPFYFLTSILSKFPAEVESRAYWSAGVIDALFGRALNVLVTRFQEHRQADDLRLLNDLLEVAFTTQQGIVRMSHAILQDDSDDNSSVDDLTEDLLEGEVDARALMYTGDTTFIIILLMLFEVK
ncbi:hypothetical protein EDD15DRAFT_2203369 [Pisolithus albus]|nr:hypothetical protein EDD15DRAFT_2203369 [Pisolithus albus]